MMQRKNYSIEWAGKTLTAEFSELADQTNGSVILKYGNTAVMATAVMGKNKREGIDYFPLTVDYEERFYASGQILGSQYVRREGRPSEDAILSGRIVDRTIRPLFPQYIRNEVQVVVTTLAIDEEDPDILGVIASSIALGVSNIPWRGPVGSVRIIRKKGEKFFQINPTFLDRNEALDLEMVVCGKDGTINMIETASKEVDEDTLSQAFNEAVKYINEIQKFQENIIKEIGKEKRSMPQDKLPEEIIKTFESEITPKVREAVLSGPGKEKINELMDKWSDVFDEKLSAYENRKAEAMQHYDEEIDKYIHKIAIDEDLRADGRGFKELRSLYAEAGGISPALHGSGIFFRGGTHIFSALTLGGPEDSLVIDSVENIGEVKKHFMHHYNFPPFSTGETGKMGGTNRRMIGHGALAEKALFGVIPSKEEFPYTIRLVSEAMASNGSTSMGSVCASTLALMDGGVPIKAPVAGIAMGLMLGEGGKYKVLTDIQGPEDHHGDMDFKVAGTKNGVTAIQLDIKVDGVPVKILEEAMRDAKEARLQILEVITKAIPEPRKELSPRAPRILTTKIQPDQIGLVIGSGGKTINQIREQTLTEINIEDDGSVFITGKDEGAKKALQIIEEMTHEYRAGEKFEGVVVKIMDFGAFVKIGYNAEGLVHISEIAPFRIEKVSEALREGEKVPVAVKEIDDRGRINLSIKLADPKFAENKGIKPPQNGSVPPSKEGPNGFRRENTN